MFVLLFLLLFLCLVKGNNYESFNITLGEQTGFFYYNSNVTIPQTFMCVKVIGTNIYFLGIETSLIPTTNYVVCKSSLTTQVVVSPRGCDNSANPSIAIEASNCIVDDQSAFIGKWANQTRLTKHD